MAFAQVDHSLPPEAQPFNPYDAPLPPDELVQPPGEAQTAPGASPEAAPDAQPKPSDDAPGPPATAEPAQPLGKAPSRAEIQDAWDDTLRESGVVRAGAWFVSPEVDQTGGFSHCKMLIPYPLRSGRRVILAVTQDPDGLSLIQVSDPRGGFGTKDYETVGVQLTLKKGPDADLSLPGTLAETVMIAEVTDWPVFRQSFGQSTRMTLIVGGQDRPFTLPATQGALDALDRCVTNEGRL
ncbi:MAG: hypothetical protein ACPGOY_06010 [Rhodospirillaceae bacterium]